MLPKDLLPVRLAALAGVAFVLLLFFSTTMLNMPHEVSDAEMLAWWADDANITTVVTSTYMQIGAAAAFLVFATGLRSVLLRKEGGQGSLTSLVYTSGVVFAALLLASTGPRGVLGIGSSVNGEPLPGVDMLRYMPQLGYLLAGAVCGSLAGVFIAATSVHALRTGALPRWQVVLGFVCAAGCIVAALTVGPFYIPVMLLWVMATSFAIWRAAGQQVEARNEAVGSAPQASLAR